ncbi:hypothetical protein L6R49_10865 [Myxococcota bacterium]|nr:hypothetical protein [Myxococcota bacterium]
MLPTARLPDLVELTPFGPAAAPDAPLDLIIEVPHGAAGPDEFFALARRLRGALPARLERFFYVNTDVGAYALSLAIAERVLAARPQTRGLLARALVPRTFLDVNRLLSASAEAYASGGVTAGVPSFITDPADLQLLAGMYTAYRAALDPIWARLAPGGLGLTPHTYAPRTVGISRVDEHIVENLEACYAPGVEETWPLRPEVDLITTTPEGLDLAPPGLADDLTQRLAALGRVAERDRSYNLHPVTLGHFRSAAWPGQVFCFEVRRDLLVRAWTPFEPMEADPEKVAPLADAFAAAILARWA